MINKLNVSDQTQSTHVAAHAERDRTGLKRTDGAQDTIQDTIEGTSIGTGLEGRSQDIIGGGAVAFAGARAARSDARVFPLAADVAAARP
jgi:hypothetical protein